MTKEIKVERIKSVTAEYLKLRSFEGSDNLKNQSEDNNGEKYSGLIPENSAGIKELVSPCFPNSFTFSTTSSQYNFIDQQYTSLRDWIHEASEPCRSELTHILFPVFLHLYLELLFDAGKQTANFFFSKHHQVFRMTRDFEQKLKLIWNEAADNCVSPYFIQSLRNGKQVIRLSEATLNYFLRYLQSSKNPTLMQIFNNHLEVELSEVSGNQCLVLRREEDTNEKSAITDFKTSEMSEASSSKSEADCSQEDLKRINSVIENLMTSKPIMPSVCSYEVHNCYNGITCARIDSDSRYLACGFESSVIKLWRLYAPCYKIVEKDGTENIELPSVDPDELPVVEPDTDGVLFCDLGKIESVSKFDEVNSENDTKSVLSRNISGGEYCCLRGHRGSVMDVSFTHCSSFLFSVGEDSNMRLWNVKKGKVMSLYQGHNYPIWCVDVSPHSVYVATGSYDQTVRVWTSVYTHPLRTLVGHTSSVDCVTFHPNCAYVASGSDDKTIRMWHINDASTSRVLVQHSAPVKSIKFSPDGRHLASGATNGEAYIWDLNAGKVLYKISPHVCRNPLVSNDSTSNVDFNSPIIGVDWSKDSRVLYSCSADGVVKGTFVKDFESFEVHELGNVIVGSTSSNVVHMSRNNHNFVASVVAIHGDR